MIRIRSIYPLIYFAVLVAVTGCQSTDNEIQDGWTTRYYKNSGAPVRSKNYADYYRSVFLEGGVICTDSLATDYYMSGEVKGKGYLVSDNPDIFNGERTTYYSDGQLESRQSFSYGKPVSDLIKYHTDGSLEKVERYSGGLLNGETTYYDYKGRIERHVIFSDGVRVKIISYYPSGNVKSILTYHDREEYSLTIEEYYESGNIKRRGEYVRESKNSSAYKPVGTPTTYDDLVQKELNIPGQILTSPSARSQRQRSSTYSRGYDLGWSTGYQDGVDGNEIWYSYNESGKAGDYLDGYSSGYQDGYTDGHNEYRERH